MLTLSTVPLEEKVGLCGGLVCPYFSGYLTIHASMYWSRGWLVSIMSFLILMILVALELSAMTAFPSKLPPFRSAEACVSVKRTR